MTTSRRDFLQTLLALGGATAALSAVGCGDDDGPAGSDSGTPRPDSGSLTDSGTTPTDSGTPDEDAGSPAEDSGTPEVDSGPEPMACEDVSVTIGPVVHGHEMTVPVAHVTEGTERTYDIRGAGTHPHTVVVTAAQFAMLAAGETVMVTSTRDAGHTHTITLVCG